jgi:Pyruvate/2-oxoacid:ferredoxin oxidoreductase gamma subunit
VSGKPVNPHAVPPIAVKYTSHLDRRTGIVIAGAAGRKINSAATLFCRGAVLSGLQVTQRNDYPVTVKSGHSVSEIILAPSEIGYTGITRPGVMLVLFKEGLNIVRSQLAAMTGEDVLFINSQLLPIETRAKLIPIDFSNAGIWANKKEAWVMVALAMILKELPLPVEHSRRRCRYGLSLLRRIWLRLQWVRN